MNQSELLIRIILTIIFGAIIGLETETREIAKKGKIKAEKEEKSRLGGLRTYGVLSLIGGVAGLFFNEGLDVIVYITFTAIILLVVAAYIENIRLKQAFGLTTEISILITFLTGFLTTSSLVDIPVVLVILVLLTFFMSQKRGFGKLIHSIKHEELIDLFKFGLVSAVVLPILPNETYVVSDVLELFEVNNIAVSEELMSISVINPFKIWMVVVIISGINLGAYLVSKAIGKRRGILLTSLVGGVISSTSTTISLATRVKDSNRNKGGGKDSDAVKANEYILAGGAIIANAVSFITAITLLSALNLDFLKAVYLPLLAMMVIGLLTGLVMVLTQKRSKVSAIDESKYELQQGNFAIAPAIKFVGLIVVITLVIQLLQLVDFEPLLLGVTALSGLVGLDPSTIALSGLISNNSIELDTAVTIFLLANAVNFLAKAVYSTIYGGRSFGLKVGIGLLITLIGTIAVVI